MEDEESSSESTPDQILRRKVNKKTTSTNIRNTNRSSSALINKNIQSTSKRTKRKRRKTKNKSSSRKKRVQSTSKTKRTTVVIDNDSSTDVDSDHDSDSTTIHVQESVIDLNDSVASDESDNDEVNPSSSTNVKTTTKTIDDVWKHFTKQSDGKITCNLCPILSSSKVMYIFFY